MIDGTLFDKLSQLASKLREDNRPFGGIQVNIYLTALYHC
jgi:hypothetical protein